MNVRTLCLGILSVGEASGYEIKKEIEEGLFSHFIDASFGSIYPALTQLNAEGLVTLRAEEQTSTHRIVSSRWAYLAGFAGGITSTLFGAGGPPYAIYLTHRGLTKEQFTGLLH